MTLFATAGPPPEVMRQAPPSVMDVDSHPDRLFIWAVVMATRRDCVLAGKDVAYGGPRVNLEAAGCL